MGAGLGGRHHSGHRRSGPFLENEEWIGHQLATLRAAGHQPTVRDEDEDHCADYLKAFGEYDGYQLFNEQRLCGSIYISDNGCGMTSWLVMVGASSGRDLIPRRRA